MERVVLPKDYHSNADLTTEYGVTGPLLYHRNGGNQLSGLSSTLYEPTGGIVTYGIAMPKGDNSPARRTISTTHSMAPDHRLDRNPARRDDIQL